MVFRFVINSFGPLSERCFLFSPVFLSNGNSYDKDLCWKKKYFEERIGQIVVERSVSRDFWNFDYHVFLVHDLNRWFVIISKFSEKRLKKSIPETISLHAFDSLSGSYPMRRVQFKLDQVHEFYKTVCKSLRASANIERSGQGNRFSVQRIQRYAYDGGPFTLFHIHAFFCRFHGGSNLKLPNQVKVIGTFYRKLVDSNPVLKPVLDNLNTLFTKDYGDRKIDTIDELVSFSTL